MKLLIVLKDSRGVSYDALVEADEEAATRLKQAATADGPLHLAAIIVESANA